MNEYLANKEYECPLCYEKFLVPRLRATRVKLIAVDNDLRPYHVGVDSVCYEVITCSRCGYSAIAKVFNFTHDKFREIIEKFLVKNYKPTKISDEIPTKVAIERFKMAIKLCEIRKAKDSEFSYLYLKLAWLYRVLRDDPNSLENEYLATKKAFQYGELALANETFPVLDFEGSVFAFLLGEMARRLGDWEKANKYIGSVILDPTAGIRLKERAKDTKEMIKNKNDK